MNSSLNNTETYKVILIGDTGVGKTSLLFRYVDNAILDVTVSIGVDFKVKTLNIENTKVRLQIWDTSGQERFRTVTRNFYKGADAVIFVFDISNPQSFESIHKWDSEFRAYGKPNAVKILVGNKTDLNNQRKVEYDIGLAIADSLGMKYYETSSKTSYESVQAVFNALAHALHEKKKNPIAEDDLVEENISQNLQMSSDNNNNNESCMC
mgnify:CR=1 FL=1